MTVTKTKRSRDMFLLVKAGKLSLSSLNQPQIYALHRHIHKRRIKFDAATGSYTVRNKKQSGDKCPNPGCTGSETKCANCKCKKEGV